MRDEYTFRARKKRVGVYFNDGHSAMSVECDKEHEANPSPRLVAAVQAARKEFNRVYLDRSPLPHAEGSIATAPNPKEAASQSQKKKKDSGGE